MPFMLKACLENSACGYFFKQPYCNTHPQGLRASKSQSEWLPGSQSKRSARASEPADALSLWRWMADGGGAEPATAARPPPPRDDDATAAVRANLAGEWDTDSDGD